MNSDVTIEIRSSEAALKDIFQALTDDGVTPEVRKIRQAEALPGPGVFEGIKFAVEVLVVLIHSREIAALVASRVGEFTNKHKTSAEVRDFATGKPLGRVDPSTSVQAITDVIEGTITGKTKA